MASGPVSEGGRYKTGLEKRADLGPSCGSGSRQGL